MMDSVIKGSAPLSSNDNANNENAQYWCKNDNNGLDNRCNVTPVTNSVIEGVTPNKTQWHPEANGGGGSAVKKIADPQMNEGDLTEEDIRNAFYDLQNGGVQPTIRKIREYLKRGSMTTIQKVVSRLRQSIAKQRVDDINDMQMTSPATRQQAEDLVLRATQDVRSKSRESQNRLANEIVNQVIKASDESQELCQVIDMKEAQKRDLQSRYDEISTSYYNDHQLIIQLQNQMQQLTTELKIKNQVDPLVDGIVRLIRLLAMSDDNITALRELLKSFQKH